jgi:hypothetical protein
MLSPDHSLWTCTAEPEWGRNREAAQMVGAELEKAVAKAVEKLENEANLQVVVGFFPSNKKGSGVSIS